MHVLLSDHTVGAVKRMPPLPYEGGSEEEEDEFIVVEYRQEDASLSGFEGRLEGPLGEFAGWNLMGELTGEYVNASSIRNEIPLRFV